MEVLACGCNKDPKVKTTKQDCGHITCDTDDCNDKMKWFPPLNFLLMLFNTDKEKKEVSQIKKFWTSTLRRGCCQQCFDKFFDSIYDDDFEMRKMLHSFIDDYDNFKTDTMERIAFLFKKLQTQDKNTIDKNPLQTKTVTFMDDTKLK